MLIYGLLIGRSTKLLKPYPTPPGPWSETMQWWQPVEQWERWCKFKGAPNDPQW